MISPITLKAIKGLLLKGIALIDAEIRKEESGSIECLHTDAAELRTMRRGNILYICNTCGEQFTEGVQDESPKTMGKRGPGKTPG